MTKTLHLPAPWRLLGLLYKRRHLTIDTVGRTLQREETKEVSVTHTWEYLMRNFSYALLAASLVLVSPQAIAHEIHVNDKTINFKDWKGGANGTTDCCDNTHCRPALSYTQRADRSWEFVVKVYPTSPTSPIERVSMPDNEVTKDNPAEDANAYWCGMFTVSTNGKFTHSNLCAFVPHHTQ